MTETKKKSQLGLAIGLGCGIPSALVVALFAGLLIFFSGQPESGVMFANEMEEYALQYIERNELLNEDEKLIAYYDVTLKMDSSEAAILTDQRVIYHHDGKNQSINLSEIERISHSDEPLIGKVIHVFDNEGGSLKIEIAPLNGGDSFVESLEHQRQVLQSQT